MCVILCLDDTQIVALRLSQLERNPMDVNKTKKRQTEGSQLSGICFENVLEEF